jgi:hypothetical protein
MQNNAIDHDNIHRKVEDDLDFIKSFSRTAISKENHDKTIRLPGRDV